MNSNSKFVFRIIFESRENYRVMNSEQTVFRAEIAGRLRTGKTIWPTVGDWVKGAPQPGGWILITEILPRKSVLQRKDPDNVSVQVLAANVDILFIVTSANQDLNLNRLDRFVTMAMSGNVVPVILINKIELAVNPHEVLDQVASRFGCVDILGISATEGWNLDGLEAYAQPGKTLALVGSSGVGKSTICNSLLNCSTIATQEIREVDGRGRHTTTHRELHITPNGAILIDSPGIRLVGLVEDSDLKTSFADIEELAHGCKFTNCLHASEPGCAIQMALESGTLSIDRWESFIKLGKELAFEKRKSNKALQAQEKKKWAKIHKENRDRYKLRGK